MLLAFVIWSFKVMTKLPWIHPLLLKGSPLADV